MVVNVNVQNDLPLTSAQPGLADLARPSPRVPMQATQFAPISNIAALKEENSRLQIDIMKADEVAAELKQKLAAAPSRPSKAASTSNEGSNATLVAISNGTHNREESTTQTAAAGNTTEKRTNKSTGGPLVSASGTLLLFEDANQFAGM